MRQTDSARARRTDSHSLRLESLESRDVPATLLVDSSPTSHTPYHQIQAAVNAAHPGDTILVDPGTYREQVTIGSKDDGIKLVSVVEHGASIVAPATLADPAAIVHVAGAHNVTVSGFTIRGPQPSLVAGVLVDQNGSAVIADNNVADIRQTAALSGNQTGYAVVVGGLTDSALNGTATIVENTISGYQKAGILMYGSGSSATIAGNIITGAGPTDVIAQNGIQVSYGASADIVANLIAGNDYTPAGTEATGILIGVGDPGTEAGRVDVSSNLLIGDEIGIAAQGQTAPLKITGNIIVGSSQDGIWFDSVHGANVSGNISTGNGRSGIYVTGDSANNQFTGNYLRGNSGPDAYDDTHGTGTAGTADHWARNQLDDSQPSGLR